ncbi:MAG: 2-C-methyl-D-erythritol 2,4-cyclodiphosphate synthase [Gammaproteobacteria bacterium]|nr:MAG: 2-C-methyl-D-erythritol 2,4-cyclodiphosphate synthase [Gammaproteobacteria bacterium]
MLKIGYGIDTHAFMEGDNIVLNGIKIKHNKAIKAHSDGDVAIHSLCDAILGASALGDIGDYFKDTDDKYKNIDSTILLKKSYQMAQQKNYKINNIDMTIITETPKISEHKNKMKENLSAILKIDIDDINIKATTCEKLGFIGGKKGISVHCVVLMEDKKC